MGKVSILGKGLTDGGRGSWGKEGERDEGWRREAVDERGKEVLC